MLVAAALCPCPPLLVPEIAAGAAPELASARAACAEAVGALAASRPDRLVVVGPGRSGVLETYPAGTRGSFRGFGVELEVRLGEGPEAGGGRTLPYGLAVGAWLLARVDRCASPVEGVAVGQETPGARCRAAGRELRESSDRVAMLVLGDGSACRTLKAPGYLDARAEPFDADVARALAAADTGALGALDEELARTLRVSGRGPWQVLAGAAEGASLGGALLYEGAPYGVGYLVASWS
ncbi:class III extradiol dioxygenase subunit B-like domain-containing protein [Streptomyces sp. HSG2]|uniref:class III extradiol dioxygenase subunit B-like domain-containing protein n=1 Tax=Streptomyces sp. HSG2 TaxID=2797167 RepID=UPI001908F588|nr:class III extradiol dioxygenase subunit B-like domain-containing protein [Streptomyces sp. HSG2]